MVPPMPVIHEETLCQTSVDRPISEDQITEGRSSGVHMIPAALSAAEDRRMTVEVRPIPDPARVQATTRVIHVVKNMALIHDVIALGHLTVLKSVSPAQGSHPRGINPISRLLLLQMFQRLRHHQLMVPPLLQPM